MLFFVWYDDIPTKPVVDKIKEAIAAYVARFEIRPSLVLVNAVDQVNMADVLVQTARTVQPNTFWIAHGDETGFQSSEHINSALLSQP
jgi:hypothetical protein